MTTAWVTPMKPLTGTNSGCLKSSDLLPLRLPLPLPLPLHRQPRAPPTCASFPRRLAAASSSSRLIEEAEGQKQQQEDEKEVVQNELRQQNASTYRTINGNASSSFRLEPMKKNQPRKPQWSRGDAPGEYGGPPLDSRLRTTWRTSKPVDPLNATGAYIWKKDWQSFLEATTSADSEAGWDAAAAAAPDGKEKDSGFLSLNRAISLDSMDVDLSAQLMKPSRAAIQRQEEEAKRLQSTGSSQKGQSKRLPWRLAPTRREEALWERSRQAVTGGSEVMAREVKISQIDRVAMAERQRIWYAELKRNLQLVTLGIGGVGTACCYLAYSPEVAGSYGFGLIGALAYIRLLGKSVDNFGVGTTAGAARQALGSPRLLIPLVLTMLYNRWNTLLVPEYGLMQLNLLPMLLGFFTYKAATLVETFKELLPAREDDAT